MDLQSYLDQAAGYLQSGFDEQANLYKKGAYDTAADNIKLAKNQKQQAKVVKAQTEKSARSTYDTAKAAANTSFADALANLKAARDYQTGQANTAYSNSSADLSKANTQALQDSYINQRQSMANLPALLAAYGVTGGGTESTIADMNRNYEGNRQSANKTYSEGLQSLQRALSDSMGDINYNYNSGLTSAQQTKNSSLQAALAALDQQKQAAVNSYSNGLADIMNALATNQSNNRSAYNQNMAALLQNKQNTQLSLAQTLAEIAAQEQAAAAAAQSSSYSSGGSASDTSSSSTLKPYNPYSKSKYGYSAGSGGYNNQTADEKLGKQTYGAWLGITR